ncbi:MAG: TetM/TetW/TetO/TetS family tetracycline resistance ribosomal protection protein [Thermoleophilia bacterium]|nr:TetM/TetW/TetO/TetS family tetracycline resistance ribosomal protection protein [Thermoleophilia bacterium]
MLRRTINLGILAHVDAGKTTLTERLLYAAGVIDTPGSVDAGTTQTDSLALERQRGITIRSAVATFAIGDVVVNLVDTPGHPDFIAEVERALGVLDGAVLVVSAVEGVQPQTIVLMRALQRLRVPTLLFVNKIDRRGADCARVLRDLRGRLGIAPVALGSVRGEGTRGAAYVRPEDGDATRARLAETLAEHDDALLAAYLEDGTGLSPGRLRREFAAQTGRALVHPVVFGSALTGAGVDALTAAVAELLPASAGDADGPLSAVVFKVERGPAGEKVAYVRLFSGTLRVRDRVPVAGGEKAKVTAIGVFDGAVAVPGTSVGAGQIAKLWGLGTVRIGDAIGDPPPRAAPGRSFAPPSLESVIVPRRAADRRALSVALGELAEQDPLIGVRLDDGAQELSVSLYGEVQKEVIEATLAGEYGLAVDFRETTPIYVERPTGTGEAVELLHAATNPFLATIGLRVDPAPLDSGLAFRLEVDARSLPLYLYKTLESFTAHMDEYVRRTLREGLFGWQVTDCAVTMNRCTYSVPDGPPSRRGPLSTAADFRKLTPLVLMQALERAGTVVCEPVVRARLELPTAGIGAVMAMLTRLGAAVETPSPRGSVCSVEAVLPAVRVRDVQRQLAGASRGEGALEFDFAGYLPVAGDQPTRRRTTPNPLDREEYLLHLARRVGP